MLNRGSTGHPVAMQRREFIALVGGAAAAWPHRAAAQNIGKNIRHLGVLLYSSPKEDPQIKVLQDGLRDLGYIDGQNISIEYRFAEGRPERLSALAADLVRLKPDVLFPIGGDVTPFISKATHTIPIVFVMSADPLQLGVVASLARPGGNATGFTFLQDELASKRLELLKQVAPRISRVAFLSNPDHPDNELRVAQRTATALGIDLHPIEMRGPGDLDGALQAITQAPVDALYVVASRQTVASIPRIVNFATKKELPLAGGWGAWTQAGGLLSYGPNVGEVVRNATTYVDKIFKGAKPGDLPVQQPTRFELLINLRTAKTLGLSIAESLLLLADKVIE
jgi:putative tryptophan/tyrosine transport system substrate-binding protein